MSNFKVTIDSIFDGISSTTHFGSKASYDSALGIDPDYPIDGQVKTSGSIIPTKYSSFKTSLIGAPMWLSTNPKDASLYAYTNTGGFYKYDKTLTTETALTSPTAGEGNGMAYYNNYIYLATPTNVARYGPMNGTPSIAQNVWTSAILGTKTQLGNFTYPSINGVKIPNHPMHVHSDNSLYFGDVVDGQGVLHKIRTQKGSVEGDTDDSSLYNAIDLPSGYIPTDIESYGPDIVILAIQTRDEVIDQGAAGLFFWDTVSDSFFNFVPLADPLGTALFNMNGRLYMWTGNASNGARLSEYIGGDSVSELVYLEEGAPPFAGAVDARGNRLSWGGYTTYPEASASVFSFGSKSRRLPAGLHNTIRTGSTGDNQVVTCLKYVQQESNIIPKLVVGWNDDAGSDIEKSGSGTYNGVWRSRLFTVGSKFKIWKVNIRLGKELAANMEIIPKFYLDDQQETVTLATINSTNFSGKQITFKRPDIIAENNFMIELNFGGTEELPVLLPVTIYGEVFEDEKAL